jgi:hypothetical protein
MRFTIAALAFSFTGCLTAEQAREDWDEHVAQSNECTADEDCVVIFTDCPLGCFTAVRAELADACSERADDLVAAYEASGARCAYDCAIAGDPYCDASGRCEVDSE